jgi:hypothetical protein
VLDSLTPLRAYVGHSATDADFSARLARDLDAALGNDEEVYNDVAASDVDSLDDVARREIEDRQVFIVVLSPDAMASPRVNAAIDLAWTLRQSPAGKRIVPVLYRPCAVRDDIDTIQRVSFASPRDYDSSLGELLGILRRGEARAAEAPLGGADAQIAVPDLRRHGLQRSSVAMALLSVLLVAVAVGALQIVPALRRTLVHGAPRATGTTSAGTATPTPHAWPTPLTTTPYNVLVPGTCAGNAGWEYTDSGNTHSYTCQTDGVELSASPQANDVFLGAMNYVAAAHAAAHAYDVSFQVRGLTGGGVVVVALNYGDGTSNDTYLMYLGRRRWYVARTGSGHTATYSLGEGDLANITNFRVEVTFHPGTLTLMAGSALNTTLRDPILPPVLPVATVLFDVEPGVSGVGASAVFSQFQFAPLAQ